MDEFTIEVDRREPAVVVALSGDATIAHAEAMRQSLRPVLDDAPARVVLDLADLVFINSLGLGVLLEFRHELGERGGQLHLAGATPPIVEILEKTRLNELFPMYNTADEALGAT